MNFETIYHLFSYLENNETQSALLVDQNLVMSKDFIRHSYNSDIFFNILKDYNYTIESAKEKIYIYLEHINNQIDDNLNSILFNPFYIEYLPKGIPVYEQEKYYDYYGDRRYSSFITGHEYYPVSSEFIDKNKIKQIKKLFKDFFYLKTLFRDKIGEDDIINNIWLFSRSWGNNDEMDNVIWKLKNIIKNDQKKKYISL